MKPLAAKRLLLGQPWAVAETAFNDLKAFIDSADFSSGTMPSAAPTITRKGSVAIVSISGVLVKRAGILDLLFGEVCELPAIESAVLSALNDDSVSSVVLDIDSCGGSCVVADTAARLQSARDASSKPIVAVGGDLLSAAYWLAACAADYIVVGQASSVGSIGTVASVADDTRQQANAGIDTATFRSSDRKMVTPLTPSNCRDLQAQVDRFAAMFSAAVSTARHWSPEQAAELSDARVLLGAEAVEAGLADSIGSLDSVVASLA